MGLVRCAIVLVGAPLAAFGLFVGVALTCKGSPLGVLILGMYALVVIVPWKIWKALLHEASLPKLRPKDPNLPSYAEFHEKWKRDHPDDAT